VVGDPRHRWHLALGLLTLVACGPAVADPNGESNAGESSTSDAPVSSTGAVNSSSTAGDPTSATSSTSTSTTTDGGDSTSTSSDEGTKLDVNTDPPLQPDPGEPPETCTMPTRLAADVSAVTPIGDATLQAAVFAQDGGGKCPVGYRVLLATDLDALQIEIDHAAAYESFGTAMTIQLELPPGSPEPGEWYAFASVWIDGDITQLAGTVSVTAVTRLDDPAPMIEGTIMIGDGDWMVSGSFSAPYCNLARGGSCGA
jgi:hypothetical protein